jgi:hypothetical protein
MQSLKDSDGKIPSLANQLIMTDEEDVNLSQLRTRVLWTNSNPTSSFASQNIVLSSGDYDYLLLFYKISYDSNAVVSKIFPKGYGTEIDISEVFNGDYVSVNRCRVITRNSDISLTVGNCQTGVLRNGGGTERYLTDNAMLVPIQIIGLYKQPAMIYTGKELHEGDWVNIKDGVISADVVYGKKVEWVTDSSITTLDGYAQYFIQDLTKVYAASVGELQSSNMKNLIGRPSWYSNYCTAFFIPELYIPGESYAKSTVVYKIIAIGALVGKIGIGYLRKDSDASTQAVFSGWYSIT